MREAIERRRVGFTLIELLVVIAIIGLLVSLVLVASADGVRRAEERATQALITKLETALNDRLDALLNTQPPINQTHRYLAAISYPQQYGNGTDYLPLSTNTDDRRAQVIAQFDYIRAELPEVFFVNTLASDGANVSGSYPLNFCAAPYPPGTNSLTNRNSNAQDGGSWVLPLGNNYPGLPTVRTPPVLAITTVSQTDGTTAVGVTGMFGASFSAAAGIYKNLGYGPRGYDGIDNDGNGLIDDLGESGTTAAAVNALLAKHTHKTARAEMLYAVLVEGLSPLGSVFSPEDFTAREVRDTDGDGLPEFIDAWGEPLQFFRWPVYYGGLPLYASTSNPVPLGTSDSQLGFRQYNSASQARETDPLDPSQLLVSPGWWSSAANPSLALPSQSKDVFVPPNANASPVTNQSSPGAIAFMNYFHSLVDPNPNSTGGATWDRASRFTRREYFTKFLILSGGPDREPGVAQFAKDYSLLVDSYQIGLPSSPYMVSFPAGRTIEQNALLLNYIENQAAVSDPAYRLMMSMSSGSFYEIPDPDTTGKTATSYLNRSANSDDITNHNISGISTGVR